jgi:hypothetical protein
VHPETQRGSSLEELNEIEDFLSLLGGQVEAALVDCLSQSHHSLLLSIRMATSG